MRRGSGELGSGIGMLLALLFLVAGCTDGSNTPATPPPLSGESADGEAATPGADDDVVRYGVSTSPSSPWAHYRTSCDTTCGIVFGAVTDTLFATTVDGDLVGLLVESFDANADGTVHTWTLRSDVRFSDGTPLDAEAVKLNIDACRHSPLTGPGLAGIEAVGADGLTVTLTSLAPWPALPNHFAETPCGHMFSAAWLSTLADLPMRTQDASYFDPVIAAVPADGDPHRPIGLGPFTVESFAPGNGNSLMLVANPSYWRGPDGITGERLPMLDRIELVVIEDDAIRLAAIETGQFDLLHTSGPGSASFDSFSSNAFADTVHLLTNGAALMADASCRRAVANSIDHRRLVADMPWVDVATGPFPPGSPGHNPDRAVPDFDPAAAGVWAQRCAQVVGPARLRLLAGEGDSRADELAVMIQRAFDGVDPAIDIDIEARSGADLGVAVLLGDFDLLLWENHGTIHPDLEFEWWFSDAAGDVGSVSPNVGRIDDPVLDRALVDLRGADDGDEVDDAVADIHRAFDGNRWATWLYWKTWTVAWNDTVDVDIERVDPTGRPLVPMIDGVHDLALVSGVQDPDN